MKNKEKATREPGVLIGSMQLLNQTDHLNHVAQVGLGLTEMIQEVQPETSPGVHTDSRHANKMQVQAMKTSYQVHERANWGNTKLKHWMMWRPWVPEESLWFMLIRERMVITMLVQDDRTEKYHHKPFNGRLQSVNDTRQHMVARRNHSKRMTLERPSLSFFMSLWVCDTHQCLEHMDQSGTLGLKRAKEWALYNSKCCGKTWLNWSKSNISYHGNNVIHNHN